jgi:hypothetical protein
MNVRLRLGAGMSALHTEFVKKSIVPHASRGPSRENR